MSDRSLKLQAKEFPEFQFPVVKNTPLLKVFYNRENGTYLTRTPGSWGKILLFYLLFYTVLVMFFLIYLQIRLWLLPDNEPKYKLQESLIGESPELSFRPISDENTNFITVIRLDTKKPANRHHFTELLDDFLGPYKSSSGNNRKDCSYDNNHDSKKSCTVDIKNFGSCSSSNQYGYQDGKPCIFIKLNKMYGWIPEYYDDTKSLPWDMPNDLKTHIRSTAAEERKQIWVSCNNTAKYIPYRGFPGYYYPFSNQPGYLSPLIAVQFESIPRNNTVYVQCRTWAKNIKYNNRNSKRSGSLLFQFFIT